MNRGARMNLSQNNTLSQTVTAFDRRLEMIRQEHLARNRSTLRELTSEQVVGVERLTSAIVDHIVHEVADALRDRLPASPDSRMSEDVSVVSAILGIV
jgi:glutamyl-tRNA reductase